MKKSLVDILPPVSTKAEAPKPKSFGAFVTNEAGETVIDRDKLKGKSIYLATPCYGGMLTDQFFLSMFRTSQVLHSYGVDHRITTIRNESLITRARNMLTAMFLDTNCTHLMFIDADIEFDETAVLRLLAHDKDLIVGAYPKKTLPIQYAINFKFLDKERKKIRTENGLAEIWDASTGFFMIKREVIEKLILEHPELRYRNDSGTDARFNKYCYALFDTMIDTADNRYLSEDYTFCRRWQNVGGEIWLDLSTKLNHIGSYTFEGDVGKLVQGLYSDSGQNTPT